MQEYEATSADKVWAALTETEQLTPSLRAIGFAPVVGTRFQLQAASRAGMDGQIECEVGSIDPTRSLVFRWQTGAMTEPATAELKLIETDNGLQIGLNRVAGDPKTCDLAKALLGKNWRRTLVQEALPRHLERMTIESR